MIKLFCGIVIAMMLLFSHSQAQEKSICENSGGKWRMFNNGCVDSCQSQRASEPVMCIQAFTYGCDCPKNECWDFDSKSCQKIKKEEKSEFSR
ncbi:hypothetical protein N9W34_04485 [Rickettsiales bacterium]|nr:hypothetical protein [Rickettsiales bacterium]